MLSDNNYVYSLCGTGIARAAQKEIRPVKICWAKILFCVLQRLFVETIDADVGYGVEIIWT